MLSADLLSAEVCITDKNGLRDGIKVIEVKGLNKAYKHFKLDNASFDLAPGMITGLIGANGAGKSTILRILSGLLKKDSGEIIVDGQTVSDIGGKLRLGFVSQELGIYHTQKMSAVAGFVRDVYKESWDEGKYEHYLRDVFDLRYDQKIKELSLGMRVKFFLAMELAKSPECLLLDEVTSGLDPVIRDEVLDILLDTAREYDIPVFMSSHITEDLEKVAERIIFIDSGRILLCDSVENIRKNYFRIEEDKLDSLDEETRALILEKGVKQHEYYVYNTGIISGGEIAGTPAMLSDVLRCLRKV
ncbi:MAG: ABC transporter ATP-binding protein [Clostridiales bacterium]|nr:ABC transporter ATP-binding protein [Clostridiales bacterium]